MADQSLPGYPQPFGSRNVNIASHQGPNPYLTGGENYYAGASAGWGSFDAVEGGASYNNSAAGTYLVRPLYPIGQAQLSASGSNNVKLGWFVAANGAQVANNTDLSAEYVRLRSFGG